MEQPSSCSMCWSISTNSSDRMTCQLPPDGGFARTRQAHQKKWRMGAVTVASHRLGWPGAGRRCRRCRAQQLLNGLAQIGRPDPAVTPAACWLAPWVTTATTPGVDSVAPDGSQQRGVAHITRGIAALAAGGIHKGQATGCAPGHGWRWRPATGWHGKAAARPSPVVPSGNDGHPHRPHPGPRPW